MGPTLEGYNTLMGQVGNLQRVGNPLVTGARYARRRLATVAQAEACPSVPSMGRI